MKGSTGRLARLPTISGVAASYEYYGSTGPATPSHEHVVGVGLEMGKVLVQLVFQGGRNVNPSSVRHYVISASRRLETCA